jgi:hypothetical protein
MQTLLVVAIIATALAIAVQAGILIAMYLLSRRAVDNVNGLVSESQKLVTPLEDVARNFQKASESLLAMGNDAREEMHRVQTMFDETHTAVRDGTQELRHRLNATVDEVHNTVMVPIREWSALTSAISAFIRTFFGKRQTLEKDLRNIPAA